jgi:hypothetical protein
MADVFTDEAGTYDLAITTAADWTVSSGGMPNGDNYVTGDGSIAATVNSNGDDFDFRDGTAWTVEFWFYYTTARAITEQIVTNSSNGTTTYQWAIQFDANETMGFYIGNTSGGVYLSASTGTLSTSTWYHIVCEKDTTDIVRIFVDTVQIASDTTTSGTARTPDANYWLYFGTNGAGAGDITSGTTGVRVSKLAIYNRLLTAGEKLDHYLAMAAS